MADFSLEKCGDLAPQGPIPHGQSSAGRQHPPHFNTRHDIPLPYSLQVHLSPLHAALLAACLCMHLHFQPFLKGSGYISFMCIWFRWREALAEWGRSLAASRLF